jgi:GTP-binding protein
VKFIDEAVIYAKAGDGGDGAVAWRREKFVPRGGPAGGDGGNGGDVIFVADDSVHSLLDFKYQRHVRAKRGENGRPKNQFGAAGDDATVKVPPGTQVFDEDSGELLCDLVEDGDTSVVCEGGSGGHGNSRFATSTRQAPDFAKPGLPGEERNLRLELKLLADVGLLGYPNAGKSTFLSVVSAAKPKVADYPFTTLVPKLGVVGVDLGKSFVLADIPGLIEGASEGHGLGIQFLKHLERVRVLCHLVEAPGPQLAEDEQRVDDSRLLYHYISLREELRRYDADLSERPEVVVVSKIDLLDEENPADNPEVAALKAFLDERKIPLHFMSAPIDVGVDELKKVLWREVRQDRSPSPERPAPYDPLKT